MAARAAVMVNGALTALGESWSDSPTCSRESSGGAYERDETQADRALRRPAAGSALAAGRHRHHVPALLLDREDPAPRPDRVRAQRRRSPPVYPRVAWRVRAGDDLGQRHHPLPAHADHRGAEPQPGRLQAGLLPYPRLPRRHRPAHRRARVRAFQGGLDPPQDDDGADQHLDVRRNCGRGLRLARKLQDQAPPHRCRRRRHGLMRGCGFRLAVRPLHQQPPRPRDRQRLFRPARRPGAQALRHPSQAPRASSRCGRSEPTR